MSACLIIPATREAEAGELLEPSEAEVDSREPLRSDPLFLF